MRYRLLVSVCISLVVGAGVLAVFASMSPWFMVGMLPKYDHELVLGIRRDQRVAGITSLAEGYIIPRAIREDVALFSRYAYSESERGSILIGLPRARFWPTVTERLQRSGWDVRRVAWYVVANTQEGGRREHTPWLTSLAFGAQRVFKEVVLGGEPANPLAILRLWPQGVPFIQSYHRAVVSMDGGTVMIRGTFGEGVSQPSVVDIRMLRDRITQPASHAAVEVPGSVVRIAPEVAVNGWQEFLRQSFGIRRTKPSLLMDLAEYPKLAVSVTERNVLIGIRGNVDEFSRLVRGWIASEVAYDNPRKRAFRLPDNTIGFEYVPGAPQDVFDSDTQHEHCEVALVHDTNLWLCRNGDRASLSNDGSYAEEFLEQEDDRNQWRISLGGDHIQSLMIPGVTSIAAGITGQQYVVLAQIHRVSH